MPTPARSRLRRVGWVIWGGNAVAAVALFALWAFPGLQGRDRLLAVAATFIPFGWVPWLVVVIGLAASLRRASVLRWLALALALAMASCQAWPLVERYTGAETEPTPTSLRVVMLNVEFGRADTARLLELASQHDADIVVILEFHPNTEAALAGVEARYPYRVGVASTTAAGTLVLSRTPLTELGHEVQVFDNWLIGTRVRGVPWTVAAVHPVAPVRTAERWLQDASRVQALVRPHLADHLVVIGDFNAINEHLTLRQFADLGLADAAVQTGAGWQPTWPLNAAVPPFATLDHALTSSSVRANRVDHVVVPGTDHKALVLTASAMGH